MTSPRPTSPSRPDEAPLAPDPLSPEAGTPQVYPLGAPMYYGPMYHVPQEPALASAAGAIAFLAGVWLAIAPFALHYAHPGEGFEGYWHDIVLGGAVAVLALARSLAPDRVRWLGVVSVVLGLWLVLAPLVLGYQEWSGSATAAVNSIAVGALVVVTAVLSAVAGRGRHRHAIPRQDRGGR
ncbi:SPW repeat protein [Saccharothrix coeruleofusca]|uniref:SPW repeat-containing integral membrane domain-containing protein n=1 Tax=Saccharothrix coeruleofusca TaxID=33919 RepID=A0A918EH64_9PSEU|nr:SPW repeat protein [Saccharothrix coeruleofusca]MBP2335886.1 lysylphosphatidylglycerol synthetase-like protein (DUF2156 family) [Saccharothrix coeruleofusca]GGP76848.1 hypothetical protein GCM10010185_58300 [Saccharothrix coeruleofusca]